jgi:phosphoenolpyruvate synthase/pyruvate phosphate dikinase
MPDKKWVYLFREGNANMRDLLGGKGAGVAEMTTASSFRPGCGNRRWPA